MIFALNTSTQNLPDEHLLTDGPPSELSKDALNTATPHLADKPTLANEPPRYSIDAFNTSTQHLTDEHTLADGPPWVIGQRCLEYRYTQLGR